MKHHDIFGMQRFGRHAVAFLLVLCGVALILLMLQAFRATNMLERGAGIQSTRSYNTGESR